MSADTDDDDDDDGSGDCANKEGQKKMNGLFSCFSCFAGHEKEDDAKNKSIRENNNGLEEISTLEDDEEENEKMNTDETETYEENAPRKDDANKNKIKKRNNAEKNKKTNNKNNNAEEIDRSQNSLSSNAGSSTSSSSSANNNKNNNNNTKIKAPPSGANRRLGSLKLTPSVQKLSIIMDDKEHEQLNQYIMIKDLGRGAHAKVKLGLNKTDNNLYALKIRNERVRVAEAAVRKEVAILKKLSHPHVLKLHEVIDDTVSNELILVLEYAPGGPIFTRFNRVPLSEKVLHGYARDIVLGLDYLHSLEIAHMDLKP